MVSSILDKFCLVEAKLATPPYTFHTNTLPRSPFLEVKQIVKPEEPVALALSVIDDAAAADSAVTRGATFLAFHIPMARNSMADSADLKFLEGTTSTPIEPGLLDKNIQDVWIAWMNARSKPIKVRESNNHSAQKAIPAPFVLSAKDPVTDELCPAVSTAGFQVPAVVGVAPDVETTDLTRQALDLNAAATKVNSTRSVASATKSTEISTKRHQPTTLDASSIAFLDFCISKDRPATSFGKLQTSVYFYV
jgi:hypothetical protein